jgi:hypothetical protein
MEVEELQLAEVRINKALVTFPGSMAGTHELIHLCKALQPDGAQNPKPHGTRRRCGFDVSIKDKRKGVQEGFGAHFDA